MTETNTLYLRAKAKVKSLFDNQQPLECVKKFNPVRVEIICRNGEVIKFNGELAVMIYNYILKKQY